MSDEAKKYYEIPKGALRDQCGIDADALTAAEADVAFHLWCELNRGNLEDAPPLPRSEIRRIQRLYSQVIHEDLRNSKPGRKPAAAG